MFEALLLAVPAPVHEAAVTSNCPADMRALNARAASATTVRLQESPGVGGIMNSTRELAPGEFRFLGVVPLSVDVKAVAGEAHMLRAMLPGHDVSRYEASFRAAVPEGDVGCDQYGCHWRLPYAADRALPVGALREISISQVYDSDTSLRFLCSYKSYAY